MNREMELGKEMFEKQRLHDDLPFCVWMIDQKGRVDYANKFARSCLRNHSGPISLSDFVFRSDLDRFSKMLREIKGPGDVKSAKLRITNSGHSFDWMFIRVEGPRDGLCHGLVYGIPTGEEYVQFILEKGENESLPPQKDADTASDLAKELGVWDWDLNTDEVRFDDRWCEILGYKSSELNQHLSTWESLVHPEDRKPALEAVKSYLAGEVEHYEKQFRMKHKDGQWIPIFSKGKVVERDEAQKPIRFAGVHVDLSGDRDSDREIKSELITRLEEETHFGGWSLDVKTMSVLWTDGIYNIYEIEDQTKALTVDEAVTYYKEQDQERIRNCVTKCIEAGTPFNERFEFVSAKGREKWVKAVGRPVTDSEGNIFALRGFFQDISEEVALEKQIESERLKTIHASRLASLGEMAAGVAHEINNPLAIIYGFVDSVQRCIEEENFKKAFDRLARIRVAVDRVSKIVRGLRRFAREDSDSLVMRVELKSLVENSMELMQERIHNSGIALRTSFEPGIFVDVHEIQVGQVLINLLSNAIHAVKSSENKWIEIEVKEENSKAFISVKDSGPGVSPDHVERVFDPFFTTKAAGEGTGLGLSISANLARQSGGELKLINASNPTEFRLELPIS